ncbi:MAG: hypothetical protein ACKOYP_00520 [Bacteroidota bacterium]
MNNKTYYHLILDRSGSMASCWDMTLHGFKAQIDAIRSAASGHPDQEIMFSTCLFNQNLEFPGGINSIRSGEFPSIHHIVPSGYTALMDAIGESIERIEFAASNELASRSASVVMVILTDGHENASRRFDSSAIQREMDRTRASGLWTFNFIGADLDVSELADRFNIGERGRKNISKETIFNTMTDTGRLMDTYLASKKAGSIRKDYF